MASMYNVDTTHHGPMGLRRRSSSISPSDSPSQARRPRRQSTFGMFAEHVDDSNQLVNDPAPDGRRKSLWGLDFMWKRREGDGYYKQVRDREQSKSMAPVVQTQEDTGRRRSKFGSLSNAIKKGLDKIRRRNDSTQDHITPTTPIGCGVGTQLLSGTASRDDPHLRREDMRSYTVELEPFARDGMLRFHNMSQSQDDLLNSPSGPSTYYEDHRFEERGCSVHDSPYRARRKRGNSPDWVYEPPGSPTPETNTEAGTDPYQWQMLSGHSPEPAPKRRGLSQYSVRQLPNFVRSSRYGNRKKRQSIATAPHAKPRGPRGVSCTPSVAESTISTFSVSKPNIFRPVPNLDFTFSFDNQIGVLPTIDSASIDTNSEVPQAHYSTVSSCSPAPPMTPLRAVPSIRNATNISTPASSNQSSSCYAGPSCNSSLRPLRPSPSVSTVPPSSSSVVPYPSSILSTVPPSMSSLSLNPPSSPSLRPARKNSSGSTMALALPSPSILPPKQPDTPPHPKPHPYPHTQRQQQTHPHMQRQQQTHPHAQGHPQPHPHTQPQQQRRDPYPYPYPNPSLLSPAQPLNSHPHSPHSQHSHNPTHTHSTPNLLSISTHNTHPHLNCTPSSGISAVTATDTASTYSGLDLRRMNSLGDVLENFNVDGEGGIGFEVEREVPACGVMCCASRGRSRIRRGDVLKGEVGRGDRWCVSGDGDAVRGSVRDV